MSGTTLVALDGRDVRRPLELVCDVAVVGSGPAGATVAHHLAATGADVVVLEEGEAHAPEDLPADAFTAMARLYRDLGTSVLLGRAPTPFLQGRAVGGTSVVNGAISWRLPRHVHAAWVADDPALGDALPWERLERIQDALSEALHIVPTDPAVAGPHNRAMAWGAAALGLEHRPIRRYTRGCRGTGRCLQGCPVGAKTSMDRTFLPDAVVRGARIAASVRVDRVELARGAAVGCTGRAAGGGRVRVRARRAVVLAASAVQTPALLLRSGLRHGPVGRRFQCHPGVSVTGWFEEPMRMWTGATQGHEVTGLVADGLKLEALGFDLALVASRVKGIGRRLAAGVAELEHWASWGAAVRAEAHGRVLAGRRRSYVTFTPARADLARYRRGVRVLGEMMLAAGARAVFPGVHGWHDRVEERSVMARFEDEAPWDARAYEAAVTHMFGTARLGSDPAASVVRPDFRHHRADRLYVADSSVFPTNTGVNPQTSIMALATLCAERVVGG